MTISIRSDAPTDAANMAGLFPYIWPLSTSIFWALFWGLVSFVILTLALRAYAVSKDKPAQPDLPFEDSPLEV